MWRNWYDIEDSWESVDFIMDYFGENSRRLATYAGPGHWNDPDMVFTYFYKIFLYLVIISK